MPGFHEWETPALTLEVLVQVAATGKLQDEVDGMGALEAAEEADDVLW